MYLKRFDGGTCLGTAELVRPTDILNTNEDDRDPVAEPIEKDQIENVHVPQESKYDPVGMLVERLPADLTTEQRRSAVQLLEKNRDVFSHNDFDLGRTHLVQHRIDTGNNRPFRQPLRRHPLAQLDVIDNHVDKLLQHGLIEPAASPWASNIVLVKKKDGSLRFCVDYRQLNATTYKDSYPLPRIESCLDSLNGASHFSTLDLRSGHWQVGMDPRDADKTAFVTRRGTFRLKVLSFGLTNAPSLFQRLMDLVLAGMTYESCLVYLDDIIVFGKSFQEHVDRLDAVLNRLRMANLKLKPSKCCLFQRSVTFLGHVISGEGLAPDPEKISVVAAQRGRFRGTCRKFDHSLDCAHITADSYVGLQRLQHRCTTSHERDDRFYGPKVVMMHLKS